MVPDQEAPSSVHGSPKVRFDERQMTFELFVRLRHAGFALGVGELLAAWRVIEGNWGAESPETLKQITSLLWCKSAEQNREFEIIWDTVFAFLTSSGNVKPEPRPPVVPPSSDERPESVKQPPPPPAETPRPASPARQTMPEWGILPVRASFTPALLENVPDFHTYGPVSRRFMVYAWRYLRRPIADGPEEILDVEATVEQAARQGYYLAPVYRRRERNHAHLVMFLDHGGSMVPFHRFTRDLVKTAQYESTIGQVDVFYFQNVLVDNVYLDPHRTLPVELERVLAQCTESTSLLIVSDAGAARGRERHLKRIRATAEFLARLRRTTSLIAWLNPMPVHRWPGTSAQVISRFVPMFQMDPDGFSNAVDVLRGQLLSRYR